MNPCLLWRHLRLSLGKKLLGSEYRRLLESKEKAIAQLLEQLDYKYMHQAYTKYTLAIIKETRKTLQIPEGTSLPTVSVIIPVYNEYKFTMRCLQSLVDTTLDISYEVLLADDNSTDETQQIANQVKNITVIKNRTTKGFLNNCNHAAKYAKGKYLYFLNNDTQLFPRTVSSLVNVLEKDQEVALVGSKCIMPNGKLQAAGSCWEKGGKTSDRGYNQNPFLEEFNRYSFVDYCTGASLMVRREFWEEEKGFDEQFSPGYYEETDLCARAKRKGLKVAYQPESEIIHFIGATFNQQTQDLITANRKKFYEKWKSFLKL